MRRVQTGSGSTIELYNDTPYASEHELGGQSDSVIVKPPKIRDASSIKVGGNIEARPFMRPSKQVLRSPYQGLVSKIEEFGWEKEN